MLIGVDEEGGTVTRVSQYLRKEKFQSPQFLYHQGGLPKIIKNTQIKCHFLQELGINVSLASVCDVSTNCHDFIYKRTFGQNDNKTSQYVKCVVDEMKKNREGCVLKHFPGYGSNADTHTNICIDKRDYQIFLTSDFLPFAAGIQSGADAILVLHNIVNCLDDKSPASLSSQVHQILRTKLHFEGVVLTDDLLMEGVRKLDDDGKVAVKAVLAGNDMLISSQPEVQLSAIYKAVKAGEIDEKIINEAVLRVLSWKENIRLFQ